MTAHRLLNIACISNPWLSNHQCLIDKKHYFTTTKTERTSLVQNTWFSKISFNGHFSNQTGHVLWQPITLELFEISRCSFYHWKADFLCYQLLRTRSPNYGQMKSILRTRMKQGWQLWLYIILSKKSINKYFF